MSKDEHGLTPLQAFIKETIEEHPVLDDKEIARLVFDKRYPDEEYEGKDPSHTYVGKIRRRLAIIGKPPEFSIEEPEEPIAYEIEEPEETEEPEIPFAEEFEPHEYEEPIITPESVEGFTLDDTEFILCFTFDKFADWTGYEGWRFKTDSTGRLIDKNERRFAGLTHRMMEKYVPDILDEYFMEFMFCYTGIMIIGSKTKGYLDWRRRNEPVLNDLKDVESTVIEKPEESEEVTEIPTPDDEEELPPGAKAKGETGFMKRIRRQTP